MRLVGLTGKIGSGKSTVGMYFAEMSVQILDADLIAKEILETDDIKVKIIDKYGKNIIENNQISPFKLREIIFNSDGNRLWLNNLLHKSIINTMLARVNKYALYTVLIIPLLNDVSNIIEYLQKIIVVEADKNISKARTIKRDNSIEKLYDDIYATQTINFNCDHDLLINNTTYADLRDKVYNLHNKYLNLFYKHVSCN